MGSKGVWLRNEEIWLHLLALILPMEDVWLCDPKGCSLPGFSVHGILQERILEWVVIPFSRGSSRPRDQTQTQGLNLDCSQILYYMSHQGSKSSPKEIAAAFFI